MDEWKALGDKHGVFSVVEASAAGMTSRDLRRLVRSGALIRLDRGWYGVSDIFVSDVDSLWDRRRRQHALRASAIIRAHRAVSSRATTRGLCSAVCLPLPRISDRST